MILTSFTKITDKDFTVVTNNIGNLGNVITFKATILTGEFLGNGCNSDATTTLFPKNIGNTDGILVPLTGKIFSYQANTVSSTFTATNGGSFNKSF